MRSSLLALPIAELISPGKISSSSIHAFNNNRIVYLFEGILYIILCLCMYIFIPYFL